MILINSEPEAHVKLTPPFKDETLRAWLLRCKVERIHHDMLCTIQELNSAKERRIT
jgi:hypothetical protein